MFKWDSVVIYVVVVNEWRVRLKSNVNRKQNSTFRVSNPSLFVGLVIAPLMYIWVNNVAKVQYSAEFEHGPNYDKALFTLYLNASNVG